MKSHLARPFELFVLVALIVGFADTGTAWGQTPDPTPEIPAAPAVEGSPCDGRVDRTEFKTDGWNLSVEWLFTVSAGENGEDENGAWQVAKHAAQAQIRFEVSIQPAAGEAGTATEGVLIEVGTVHHTRATVQKGNLQTTKKAALERAIRRREQMDRTEEVVLVDSTVTFKGVFVVAHLDGPAFIADEKVPNAIIVNQEGSLELFRVGDGITNAPTEEMVFVNAPR